MTLMHEETDIGMEKKIEKVQKQSEREILYNKSGNSNQRGKHRVFNKSSWNNWIYISHFKQGYIPNGSRFKYKA